MLETEERFASSLLVVSCLFFALLLMAVARIALRSSGGPKLVTSTTASSPFEVAVNASTTLLLRPHAETRSLLARCPALQRGYKPTPWLLSHTTTLFGNGCRTKVDGLSFDPQDVRLPDGGLIRLQWLKLQEASSPTRPVMLIVPGTRGDSNSPYVRQMAWLASEQGGFDVVVAPLRGCGVETLATPQCFDGSHHTDFGPVIAAIRAQIPAGTPIVAAGYSMGAGFLANHVAAAGDDCGLEAAVAISAAADYTGLVAGLQDTYAGLFFQRLLLSVVKRKFAPHKDVFASVPGVSVAGAMKAKTIIDWHHAVTCPLRGIESSKEFCDTASFHHLLHNAKVPLLFINDRADPLCPADNIPASAVEENHNLILCRTRGAGHTAFLEGLWPFGSRNVASHWDSRVVLEFLTAALTLAEEKEIKRRGTTVGASVASAAAESSLGRRVPVPPPLDLEADIRRSPSLASLQMAPCLSRSPTSSPAASSSSSSSISSGRSSQSSKRRAGKSPKRSRSPSTASRGRVSVSAKR